MCRLPQLWPAGGQETWEELHLVRGLCRPDSFLLGDEPSACCTRPTHGREGSLLSPKSTDLSDHFIQTHLRRNIQNMCDPISGQTASPQERETINAWSVVPSFPS